MRLLLRHLLTTGIIGALLLSTTVAWGQVRSSTNFQIERDSVNAGGALGTSSSFILNDTVGEVASGRGTSTNFILEAGFQQQPEITLTLTGGADVVMDASIGGVSGGVSNGSTSVNASTDGAAGYQLTIVASQDPAMQSGSDTIADYSPAGANPDVNFITGSSDAHLAFSPFGTNLASRYLTNGSSCGSGSASTTACWDGLSTTPVTIASAAGANAPAGATTTIYFKVGVGGSVIQPPGTYVATTTVTLLSL